jgi:hypothetical protein
MSNVGKRNVAFLPRGQMFGIAPFRIVTEIENKKEINEIHLKNVKNTFDIQNYAAT